jgi:hypothetical protein
MLLIKGNLDHDVKPLTILKDDLQDSTDGLLQDALHHVIPLLDGVAPSRGPI